MQNSNTKIFMIITFIIKLRHRLVLVVREIQISNLFLIKYFFLGFFFFFLIKYFMLTETEEVIIFFFYTTNNVAFTTVGWYNCL